MSLFEFVLKVFRSLCLLFVILLFFSSYSFEYTICFLLFLYV